MPLYGPHVVDTAGYCGLCLQRVDLGNRGSGCLKNANPAELDSRKYALLHAAALIASNLKVVDRDGSHREPTAMEAVNRAQSLLEEIENPSPLPEVTV